MTTDKTTKSNIMKLIFTFIILIAAECLFLVLSALIPRDMIQENITESADYLCERDVFFYAKVGDKSSRIDRYADSILLNIAYNYQSDNPLTSVMSSSYYYSPDTNENLNLRYAVSENPAPTLEYSRYWHGSISIIRPLLTVFNIKQIYIINAVLLILFVTTLLILMYKYIGKGVALCFSIAAIMTSLWYVPMSLEYTWTIIIMLVAAIACTLQLKSGKANFLLFFFIIGNVTAYFDFLTTETLTLLVPMALIIIHSHLHNSIDSFSSEVKRQISYGISWIAGYGLTWIAKWSLASVVLNKNVFIAALSQASYRASGEADNLSGFAQRIGAEGRNASILFPFSLLGDNSLPATIISLFVALCVFFLIRKEKCNLNILLLIVAVVPYIRYFLLANHSYMHYFFTFRAQLVAVFCLGLMLTYGSDRALITKEWSKLWKKKKR